MIAPATANTIARLALGLADDLLGAVALSTTRAAADRAGDGAAYVRATRPRRATWPRCASAARW